MLLQTRPSVLAYLRCCEFSFTLHFPKYGCKHLVTVIIKTAFHKEATGFSIGKPLLHGYHLLPEVVK